MHKLLCLITSLFLLAGCGAVSVQTEGNMPAAVTQGKATYSWSEEAVPSNDLRINDAEIANMVRSSAEKHLAAMGYARVDAGEADYLLNWFGNITEEVKEISIVNFYNRTGYAGLIGTMPEDVKDGKVRKTFSRGTLILDVVDARTKKVVWRGSATNTLKEKMSEMEKARYIDTSVQKILEELPNSNS